MDPTSASNLSRVSIVCGERCRDNGGREIASRALREEPVDLVDIVWRPVDFKVFLIVLDQTGLRADKIVQDQSIQWRSIGGRIDILMSSEELYNWIYNRDLVTQVGGKIVLCIIKLAGKSREVAGQHSRCQ